MKKLIYKLFSLSFVLVSLSSCRLSDFFMSNSSSSSSSVSSSVSSTSDSSSTTTTTTTSSSTSSSITTTDLTNIDKTIKKLGIPKQKGSFTIPGTDIVIKEDGYYKTKLKVMAYVMAFKKRPDNYYLASERETCKSKLGNMCMLYGSQSFGNREELLNPKYRYNEMDLYMDDQSYTETNARGTIRLVYTVSSSNYNEHAIYYSFSHYDDFQEFLNYALPDTNNTPMMGEKFTEKYSTGKNPTYKVGSQIYYLNNGVGYLIQVGDTSIVKQKNNILYLESNRKYLY